MSDPESDPEMKLTKEDIAIEPIDTPECDHQGEHCTSTATHRVTCEFRVAGQKCSVLGDYCETCAGEVAKALQESLPSYDTQEKLALAEARAKELQQIIDAGKAANREQAVRIDELGRMLSTCREQLEKSKPV